MVWPKPSRKLSNLSSVINFRAADLLSSGNCKSLPVAYSSVLSNYLIGPRKLHRFLVVTLLITITALFSCIPFKNFQSWKRFLPTGRIPKTNSFQKAPNRHFQHLQRLIQIEVTDFRWIERSRTCKLFLTSSPGNLIFWKTCANPLKIKLRPENTAPTFSGQIALCIKTIS